MIAVVLHPISWVDDSPDSPLRLSIRLAYKGTKEAGWTSRTWWWELRLWPASKETTGDATSVITLPSLLYTSSVLSLDFACSISLTPRSPGCWFLWKSNVGEVQIWIKPCGAALGNWRLWGSLRILLLKLAFAVEVELVDLTSPLF